MELLLFGTISVLDAISCVAPFILVYLVHSLYKDSYGVQRKVVPTTPAKVITLSNLTPNQQELLKNILREPTYSVVLGKQPNMPLHLAIADAFCDEEHPYSMLPLQQINLLSTSITGIILQKK